MKMENLVTHEMISNLCLQIGKKEKSLEIAFFPTRVLMQDFTGVPAVADLAAMREALILRILIQKKLILLLGLIL